MAPWLSAPTSFLVLPAVRFTVCGAIRCLWRILVRCLNADGSSFQCNHSSQWRSNPPGPLSDRRHGVCGQPHRQAAIRRSSISISSISYHAGPLSDLASAGGCWQLVRPMARKKAKPWCVSSRKSRPVTASPSFLLPRCLSQPGHAPCYIHTLHVLLLHMPVPVIGLRNTPRRLILSLTAAPWPSQPNLPTFDGGLMP
jgi:hypothetical protein